MARHHMMHFKCTAVTLSGCGHGRADALRAGVHGAEPRAGARARGAAAAQRAERADQPAQHEVLAHSAHAHCAHARTAVCAGNSKLEQLMYIVGNDKYLAFITILLYHSLTTFNTFIP